VTEYFGLVEGAFLLAVVVAFYLWQMHDLKREKRKWDDEKNG
jgi:hypothetical protein